MPKVSVIIPVYGVEKFIERCAVSLLEQTLDDIEYIFIDDCTKDASIEILRKVLLRYPNRASQVRIESMPHNSGLPAVRKRGLSLANGEYVAHCDSDDWVEVTAYEKLYEKAVKNDLDMVFCDYYKSNGKSHTVVSRRIDFTSKDDILKSITKNADWCVWSGIARRSLYLDNLITFPKNNNGEDFALMFQLIFYAKSYSRVNEPLYFYYLNQKSITNAQTETAYLNRLNQLIENTKLVIGFIENNKKSKEYNSLINCYKLYCRTKISPLTRQSKYHKLWLTTFPELSVANVVFNNIIPFRTKLHYFAVRLHLYHLIFN